MTDLNGHGTQMAGIICAKPNGIAPGVNLTIVRVMDQNGVGTVNNLLSGINWVVTDYGLSTPRKHSIIK